MDKMKMTNKYQANKWKKRRAFKSILVQFTSLEEKEREKKIENKTNFFSFESECA